MTTQPSTTAPQAADVATRPQAGRVALITGATSGLGRAAAVLFAEQGAELVLVTGRTAIRAEATARELRKETGRDVFRSIELDLSDQASPTNAAAAVAALGVTIDRLILNAGMVSGTGLAHTSEGFELTVASSLIGHHRLAMALLAADQLAADARIVISGSEAARGDLPTFTPFDLAKLADKHHDGDLVDAIGGILTWDTRTKFNPGDVYATTKLLVAYWAAELADRLPATMAVNAVSPGSAPYTDADRNMNFFMKRIMLPVTKALPKFAGVAAPTPVAAQRYLDATTWPATYSGDFYASAPKKMTGPLFRVVLEHVRDRTASAASWTALVEATSVDAPAVRPVG